MSREIPKSASADPVTSSAMNDVVIARMNRIREEMIVSFLHIVNRGCPVYRQCYIHIGAILLMPEPFIVFVVIYF